MKVFLDTSLLSDAGLAGFAKEIAEGVETGSTFYLSAITHFQLQWGYSMAGMSKAKYETFLSATKVEVAPLTKTDSEQAASMKPVEADIPDALIAATAKRYDATIWTYDKDFLKFLPKARVRLLRRSPEGER
ncbi:MAG: PIN domain-containing protein [Thaumarchaeota archaeon]|nr:PIN domain-containing protein [Nitrososphaerota archaeon]